MRRLYNAHENEKNPGVRRQFFWLKTWAAPLMIAGKGHLLSGNQWPWAQLRILHTFSRFFLVDFRVGPANIPQDAWHLLIFIVCECWKLRVLMVLFGVLTHSTRWDLVLSLMISKWAEDVLLKYSVLGLRYFFSFNTVIYDDLRTSYLSVVHVERCLGFVLIDEETRWEDRAHGGASAL